MQKTRVKVLGSKIADYKHMFYTNGSLELGDSGGPLILEESGNRVVGGIHSGTANTYDKYNNKQEIRLFIRACDFVLWVNKQMEFLM
ncbi:hypothetical protein ACQ4LE_005830 [Meloidogyne hapla]